MNIKKELYNQCVLFVNKKLQTIENTIKSNQQALQSETKSSAGDKHETGRAMLQLEMEKAGQQLKVVSEMKQQLDKLKIDVLNKVVGLGSIVYTNQFNYFIAISVGKLAVENQTYYAISSNSPIGQLFLGKNQGDVITFRNQQIEIKKLT